MRSVVERWASDAPVSVIVGGLAPGTTEPLDARTKSSIRDHWTHVHEASGQPFDFGFFDQDGFVYDTEPPCRAVVAARMIRPERALPFLSHLHGAFYRDRRDVTDTETLCDLAADFGFDRGEFARQLDDAATRQMTHRDFTLSRELGISGYPTLVGHDGENLTAITVGYRPWEQIERGIESWLAGEASSSAHGRRGMREDSPKT